MQDVADAAGVALGTVSNVLNHPGKVSASTAQRVRDAIERLGFVRNDAARSLASGSNNSIGFVLADLDNSLFVDMARGAQEAARAAGYHVLLASADCEMAQQDQYLDLFDEARVTGVLLAPMEDSAEAIARMRSHRRQIVLLNFAPQPGSCCSVLVDNERVGYLAAKHLIEAGRRRLVFVAARDDGGGWPGGCAACRGSAGGGGWPGGCAACRGSAGGGGWPGGCVACRGPAGRDHRRHRPVGQRDRRGTGARRCAGACPGCDRGLRERPLRR
jgi:ABC-type sugar transport system substrate-binding protein